MLLVAKFVQYVAETCCLLWIYTKYELSNHKWRIDQPILINNKEVRFNTPQRSVHSEINNGKKQKNMNHLKRTVRDDCLWVDQ